MAANDIVREVLIALIRLRERATSLITDIVFHELELPRATVACRLLELMIPPLTCWVVWW
jgi:hypothetical protein